MHVANHSQLSVMKTAQRGTERKDPTYRQSVLILDILQDLSLHVHLHYQHLHEPTPTRTPTPPPESLMIRLLSIDCQDQELLRICVLGEVSIAFEIHNQIKFILKITRAQFVWPNMSWILIWLLCHVCTFFITNVRNNGSEFFLSNVQFVKLVLIENIFKHLSAP